MLKLKNLKPYWKVLLVALLVLVAISWTADSVFAAEETPETYDYVYGHVRYTYDSSPAIGIPVHITCTDGTHTYTATTNTIDDEDYSDKGFYQFEIPQNYNDITITIDVPAGYNCNPESIVLSGDSHEGSHYYQYNDFGLSVPTPELDFSANQTSGYAPLCVEFQPIIPSEDYSDLEWDFDDGSTSDETAPVHTFTSAGTYHVSLTVWHEGYFKKVGDSNEDGDYFDDYGEPETVTKTITVYTVGAVTPTPTPGQPFTIDMSEFYARTNPAPTATPTVTPTATPTVTPTAMPTATATATPVVTATASATILPTPAPTTVAQTSPDSGMCWGIALLLLVIAVLVIAYYYWKNQQSKKK